LRLRKGVFRKNDIVNLETLMPDFLKMEADLLLRIFNRRSAGRWRRGGRVNDGIAWDLRRRPCDRRIQWRGQ
jgi:hypothetical protein